MNMIENQTLSKAKEIIVEARISKFMKAMAMPGDFIGISNPLKIEPSNYLLLKINSIVTEENEISFILYCVQISKIKKK